MTLWSFTALLRDSDRVSAVGTLGPPGTSSEAAAGHFIRLSGSDSPQPAIHLFDTYEEAGAALRTDHVTHLIVANAYSAVNQFYMDPCLALTNVFVMDTPLYGIAAPHNDGPVPDSPTIATHPAPEPIIGQLLSPKHSTYKVIHSTSTSAAAQAVTDGIADLALTTVPSAERHGLEFISATRPILMVWSVFTRTQPAAATA
ncbi:MULTISPECIES: hypothetical protein [unclassified Streptomyces]|uniref:hypothetical protein n=1 Tax=unclassified Streptomyces TaxID=2593676 RepID=UPI002DDA8CA1|nr:hypothetical protein [Streptomyces sp. NBC_01750]WSA97989.1 hypothetical protein OIE54_01155 [Streptomyces sp. NBC_01794]WSD37458.1 hypothetical protein OG966_39530 [Streptomyces sp. NBC_01750]